ncbi:hypothetical protein M9H77_17190 [Catharanthus roseus]|uniref:Uncharacterized protein n=1 Tax=Catharanthus roseus TaxID=4058 RepID=A0ACC0B3W5_CATRO|nr:hypothetical protein M9H77_17190 [Catharanthus roseus]
MRMTCLVSIQMERSCSLATVDCQNMCSRIHGDSSLMENLSRVVRASTNVIRSLVRLIFPFCCVSTLESILEAKWNIEGKTPKGFCAMYNICGSRTDAKVLNCPYDTPSVKPDEFLSSKIPSLCPTITGNVCRTEAQFEALW